MKQFKIVRVGPGDDGTLQCSYKDCKGRFTVNRDLFKAKPHIGRPCPYCFRCSAVPGRTEKAEDKWPSTR